MKKIKLGQFIEDDIDDLEEKTIIWALNTYAPSGEFDLVLKMKWKLAKMYQSGGCI